MKTENSVSIPSRAWYGDEELELAFPPGWEVVTCGPADAPALTPAQIEAAFAKPIGVSTISEAARGRKSAAVICDDLGRPTPASQLLPTVLAQLAAAGIPRERTTIIIGGGSHRPLTGEEIVKKVGAEVAAAYTVRCHDFMAGDLTGCGSLPDGMPIYIDRAVAAAEFKMAVGGIYPHGAVGFGGGSKLVLPGVSGFATMFHFHTFYASRGQGTIENTTGVRDHRDVSEDVARHIGLDLVVNCVINSRRQIAGLFVGDFVQAQRAGARLAKATYATHIPAALRARADVAVFNAYPLDSDPIQGGKALWARKYFEKAYSVLINPASDGIDYHGLHHRLDWGRYLLRRAAVERQPDPEPYVNGRDNLLVWSEQSRNDEFASRHPGAVLFRRWENLIEQLAKRVPADATVAVFPCSAIQILAEVEARGTQESLERAGAQ